MVASLIENELRGLPDNTVPKTILLDINSWKRFIYEVQTAAELADSEIHYAWLDACEKMKRMGLHPSKVYEIECPEMMVSFRKNLYIKGIRVLYSNMKRRTR